ncbi:hypothetical protein V6N13_090768 [Hibiscus sabdariffa]
MALDLVQLEEITVKNCPKMEYIIKKGAEETPIDLVLLPNLWLIKLESCSELKSFCMGSITLDCPSLIRIEVDDCPKLHAMACTGEIDGGEIFNDKVVFKNLKVLEVGECNNLKYIFSVSMALDLVQLEHIRVKNCPKMEYIIKKGAEETTIDLVLLPNLWLIELDSCSELKSFCMGSITLDFPSLIRIEVDDCPKLYAMACTGEIGGGEKTPFFNKNVEEIIFTDESATTLEEEVIFFNKLEKLNLVMLPKLRTFWRGEYSEIDAPFLINQKVVFKYLTDLEVSRCNISSKYIFNVSMALELVQLQVIKVKNCHTIELIIKKSAEETTIDTLSLRNLKMIKLESCSELTCFCMGSITLLQCPSLEEIEVNDCPKMYAMATPREEGGGEKTPFFNDKVEFPRLKSLKIQGIGKCGKIWDDKARVDSFYELTHIWVLDCSRLLNIFPLYMVERLEKLVVLRIRVCESLEEIIRADDDDRLHSTESHTATGTSTQSIELKSIPKFVFPKLQTLSLVVLPKLKGFYSKRHTTEWPSLKRLLVGGCKVETLAGEYINFQETQGESQPLFWVTQETFPNLQKLDLLEIGNMKEIWHGPLPNQYFFNLTSLLLTSVTIPNCFIQSLPNLKKLSVERVALNGLFPCKGLGDEDEHAGTLANLKELRLSELSLTEVFCNLEILQALGCDKLKNLVPSSVSFKHLTTLQVSQCHGFKNLVTFTTGKSMVQLTRMTVTDCEMLEEIIASTTDEVTDGIVFSQLKSLELVRLPTLSRFCSGNYTMVFPSLEEVIIRQCPKIKFFTKGKLSTPMLHGLQSTKDEYVGRWEGDLNVILQQLFVEKGIPSLEDLELSSINIQLVWKHKLLPTCSYAQNLTCLTIKGCHNFNRLFSSSMVKSFVQLKTLKVENCENMENVIFEKELTKEEMMNKKTFRVLEFLSLKDLPRLTRFCNGNYFEFPLLTSLSIETCPTLKTFISDAEENNSEIASPTLFNEKVAFPCLEEVTIIGVGNWRTIWQQHPTNRVRIHFANC